MKKSGKRLVDRRKFLKGAAVGGVATLVASTGAAGAQQSLVARSAPAPAIPPIPRAEADPSAEVNVLTADRTGSDFMVDVIKALGFEYVAANPGSSFRALHESLVNYGGNKNPEFITCCHEESSVALAQGYSAVEGKPMLVLAHSTVGLQHASMGIYNAWAGRAPIFIILGNTVDAAERRPGVEWDHSAQDAAAMVRDYTKWDDVPASLPHFAESAVRAYRIAMTPPREPVVLVADSTLQESPIPQNATFHIPKLTLDTAPQGDSGSVAEAARLLVAADNPVVIAGHVVRSQASMQQFIEFAEALQVPIVDQGGNLPSRHPLNQSLGGRGLIASADVILGLNVEDFWGALHNYRDQLHRSYQSITRSNAKLITITTGDLYLKSNYQDFQRLQDVDLAMAADPEVTLASLTEAVKRLTTDDRKRVFQDRGAKLAAANHKAAEQARVDASYAWEASPISIPRLSAEVWAAVKNEDWAGGIGGVEWNYEKYYQRTRLSSAAGVGFAAPSAVGAALAQRKNGRLYVHQQNDGDLMYAPGVLWTAAHHRIPMLWVMHNNRAYHQEVMHLQRMANRHQRGIENAGIGTTILDPNIDYAKLAQSMGWYAEGPISDPKDLGPALRRAVDVVKRGQPALLDTVTQPR
ncbi:MAG: thiamine pyrophosphate-binding protein [Acidobacteria bacterium]|nr:MAG: thiamine pyrophosphate-binding protein [Acidobacteriota bacterium]